MADSENDNDRIAPSCVVCKFNIEDVCNSANACYKYSEFEPRDEYVNESTNPTSPDSENEEIEVGDIVSIKHGQIMMIAEGVDFPDTICVWYDIDHKLQREKIKTEILVKHEPEDFDDRN